MSEQQLTNKRVMILVSNGVDESVMSLVQREMLKTGATIKTVGTETGLVNSWNDNSWGLYFPVDQQIGQTLGSDFDCLIVPSGTRSVQKLAATPHAERIISSFITAGKPMAFMGNAVELLVKTGLASGWNVTGPESVHQVMTGAGAKWSGETVCTHNALMTGVCEDVEAFVQSMIGHFAQDAQMQAAA